MHDTRYLIVGAGMAGDMAARGVREHDPNGSIVLVGAEPHPPYKRPLLSKGLWKGAPEAKLWREPVDGVELVTGRRIVSVDLDAHRATDDACEEYAWEKLLFATGARPRELAGGEGVVHFRTLDDYRALRERAGDGARAVVIGGGFIGSELAAALQGDGAHVTMVFPEPGIGHRLFPADLSEFVSGYYRERGIEVLAGEAVAAVEDGAVRLGSGRTLESDVVVAGLGVIPNVELAEAAGLPLENGIVVDEYGRAGGRDDVFAAGDVANFPLLPLGIRTRVEHEDHANSHGKAVGANMAGAARPYDHLPLFYSDLFDLGYEAVGEVDSRLATEARWEEPFRKGVVAYLDAERRPRGYLLWNVWDRVDDARAAIRGARPVGEELLAV
jgi:3-phenylpropionate/trans-cinnamate dioxygenase ferredoxin reductase subunit